MYTSALEWLKHTLFNLYAMFTGMIMATLGYLSPINNVVQVLLFFFFIDILFGYWAAYKLRNEKFSVKLIWEHTVPRMILSLTLVILAFMWDTTFNQSFVSTYNLIAWFISGVLIYSIAENGYGITRWKVFKKIQTSLSDKVEGETGVNVSKE